MKVEFLDPETVSDKQVAAWHACVVASYGALWPDEPAPPFAYVAQRVRNPGTVRPHRVLVAWDDNGDRVLGAVETWWWDGANAHRVMADLYVDPAHRRRGVGRALVDELSELARVDGRTGLLGGARYDTGGVEFVTTYGAKFGLDEYRSRLVLPEATIEEFAVPGFSAVRWVDRCPDAWLESYCRVSEVMNTVPQGGDVIWNDDLWDPERMRKSEEDAIAKALIMYNVCIADDATGELVALTNVQVASTWPGVGEQHNTGVHPDYRGRGLAKLVKTEMALWLQRDLPDLRLISTWNAVENAPMLAVNAAMGYGNRERWCEVEIVLG